MGVPLFPLAAAYGLGLGHLAGQGFYNHFVSPSASNQLSTWNHPSRTVSISTNGARTSTARMAKRGRSATRTVRKKRGGRRGRLNRRIPRALLPNSKVLRFKTVDCQSLDFSASTNVQMVAFSMMNLLDPLAASGAQQPLGFDQISALYKRAVVIGVKIILRVHNQSNVAMMVGISPMREAQGTTALGSAEYYMEANGTKSRLLSPDMDHQLIVHKVGTRRWFGVQSLKDESALQCELSTPTAPTRDAYIHVWAQPLNVSIAPTDGTDRVEFAVTLEHLVRVWDPIIPGRSVV